MSKSNQQTLNNNAIGYQDSIVLNINLPKEEKKEFKLFKLPTIPEIFGREDDYQNYKETIQEDNKLLLSTAIGGVGKTDFSVYFARQTLKEGLIDRAIFLNVGATRVSPANPVFSLKEILINEVKKFFPNKANNDCLEIVSNNLLEIKASQQRNLLILDDVSSDWLLEAENQTVLREYFSEDWCVLATSRHATNDKDVDNFKVLKLDFLSPEASRQLFLKHYPEAEKEGQALEEILAKLGGHALLVDLVSRATYSQKSIQGLRDFNTGLDGLLKEIGNQEIFRSNPNNDRTVEGILKYTFDYANLNPQEQIILKYFSLLPSEKISIGILTDLFKKEFGIDEKLDLKQKKLSVKQRLDKLSKKGWLDAGGEGYKAHNLIQVLAKQELKPEAGDYFQVGYALQENNQFEFAEKNYQQTLKLYRKLAKQSPEIYNPKVAGTLNNLANLQNDQGEFKEAEKNFKEALEIRRKLAEESPEVYNPYVANTLNNLAVLQKNQGEFKEAEKNFKEALEIRRKLAEESPEVYNPDVADTLNNLANLQAYQREFKEAEKNYKEALKLYRKLADQSPQVYNQYVATTLNNLAILQADQGEFKEAEKNYKEALEIRRKLAEQSPQVYNPKVAMTLNNLAVLQKNQGEFKEAEKNYQVALEKYRKLAEQSPEVYNPDVAMTLNNLAILQKDQGEFNEAEKNYKEALEKYRKLAEQSPKGYGIDLANTIVMGVDLLNQDKSQLKEARSILEEFKHIPRAIKLLGTIDKLENQ